MFDVARQIRRSLSVVENCRACISFQTGCKEPNAQFFFFCVGLVLYALTFKVFLATISAVVVFAERGVMR